MYDESLVAKLLPPELIIKNYIKGDISCNYEKYLLDYVNASVFFRKKSKGIVYVSPLSEEAGQCDCISESYQMDFKLIASKTSLQARSILCVRKTLLAKGVIAIGPPSKENGKIQATRIYAALRDYDLHMLCELRHEAPKKQGVENDIFELLKTLETKKNLLLFFPYEFMFDNNHEFWEGLSQIINALSVDFQSSMQYRNFASNGWETYMAFVFSGNMVFLQEHENSLEYVDHVDLAKSTIYSNLLRYRE